MQQRIVFITSGHLPFDDRIFYHLADSLSNYQPVIVSTRQNHTETIGNIRIDSFDGTSLSTSNKTNKILETVSQYAPDLIICSEPYPLIVARKFKKQSPKQVKIVYDVTEWYSGKINTRGLNFPLKELKKVTLTAYNLYASCFADAFLFGEYYKSILYRYIFPFKKWEIITYYPNLKYIQFTPKTTPNTPLCLGYTGQLSEEKGIVNFFKTVCFFIKKHPDLPIKLKFIGWFTSEKDKTLFENLAKQIPSIPIEFCGEQDYLKFSSALVDMDIIFDLRKIDFENNHSLPIKLFYYLACGKPIIYSGLKAIKREVNYSHCGFLVFINILQTKKNMYCIAKLQDKMPNTCITGI
jgi:glycosyltransferase involved in cell wall biosynthesis